jgi:MEDS: MEthanogen/methylotroph, DcmR Sensory domain
MASALAKSGLAIESESMSTVFDSPTPSPVTLCGQRLPRSAHICAFFDSRDQEYDCIAPYFEEGLRQCEQVVSIRDAGECAPHLERLRSRIPQSLDEPVRTNQLRIVASEETYLQDGCFEGERMYRMLEDLLRDAASSRFKRVRTCGDMSWALREMPGTDELMEYEARVNQLTRKYDCTLMCAYDVNRFSGKAVMDVLATHPMVVMGERIYENPYYVEPTDFLATLLRRGPAALARAQPPLVQHQ